jgi:tRNA dimethylallyltransferase
VEPTPPTVALVGPTASGKSAIALEVARRVNGPARAATTGGHAPGVELVSVDSMAVYRGMDIGTAKPTAADRARVPYHLLDLVGPADEFTVRQFQDAARSSLADIAARGRSALLVGGTGLYLRSVVDGLSFPGRFPRVAEELDSGLAGAGPPGSPGEQAALAALHRRLTGLDPVAAGRIEPTNRRRLVRAMEVTVGAGRPFSSFGPGLDRYPPTAVVQVGVLADPAVIDRRIAERFGTWMELGLLEEVRSLLADGLSRTARQALGYRELLGHLEEGIPLDEAVDQAIRRSRAFARRQMAWFRRDPRIVWLDPDGDPAGWIVAHLGHDGPGPAAVGE